MKDPGRARFPNPQCCSLASRSGFTILEILVATAIMGIAVAVVLQLFSANIRAVSLSADYVYASAKAEAKMKEIVNSDEKISEGSFSESTPDGYRIDVSVAETLKERSETLPVKLLQIDLTIHWFRGKEKSLKMSTLKVVKKEVL